MTEIMIYKMSQLPNNVAIDEPIPGKTCFNNTIFFEKTYTKSNGCNGEKTRNKPVENKDQKRYFIFFYFELFVNNRSCDLNKQKQRHNG